MCPDVYLLEKLIKGGFKGLNLGITKLGKDPFKAISSNRDNKLNILTPIWFLLFI